MAGTGNLYCDNTFKFNITSGFDSNYEELNSNKDSFFSGFDFSNLLEIQKLNFSSLTNFDFKNFSKNLYDFTQEISLKYNLGETFLGFNYFRDRNDEQNSYYGYYFQQSIKIFNFELSYLGFYKDYLKDYKYGSYKSFKGNRFARLKYRRRKKQHSSKNEHDFYQNLYFKYLKLKNFEPEIGYSVNNSNIKKEEFASLYFEMSYSKYFKKFYYSIYFKAENFDYIHPKRHDINFVADFYSEYYFYSNYFFGFNFQYINNDSNYNRESYKRFSFEFSIGVLF